MSIYQRTLAGECEMTTGVFTPTTVMPVFTGDNNATQVAVTFKNGGAAYNIPSGVTVLAHLHYASKPAMTVSVAMTVATNVATCLIPESFTALSGSPQMVIRMTDAVGGDTVACAFTVNVKAAVSENAIYLTPPSPDAIVYVGRAPYIGENDNWYEWDEATQAYVDTGVSATIAYASDIPTDTTDVSVQDALDAHTTQLADIAPLMQQTASLLVAQIYPVPSSPLDVTVITVATQAGSGTPSPDNIRAISGKASVKVDLSDGATVSTELTLTPASTLYGVSGAEDEIGVDGNETHNTVFKSFSGSETIQNTGTAPNTNYVCVSIYTTSVPNCATNPKLLCNFFSTGTLVGGVSVECIWPNTTGSNFGFVIARSRLTAYGATSDRATHPAAVAAWLSAKNSAGTPVQVVYQRATPTTTQGAAQTLVALAQVDKYTPRINSVYSNDGNVVVKYSKSPIQTELEKADKVTNPIEGNIVTVLADGSLADGGASISDLLFASAGSPYDSLPVTTASTVITNPSWYKGTAIPNVENGSLYLFVMKIVGAAYADFTAIAEMRSASWYYTSRVRSAMATDAENQTKVLVGVFNGESLPTIYVYGQSNNQTHTTESTISFYWYEITDVSYSSAINISMVASRVCSGKSITDYMYKKEWYGDGFIDTHWNGGNALVIGDSLTAAGVWQLKLSTILGMTVTTHALGGIGLVSMVDGTSGLSALTSTDVTGKDLIVLYGGYNNRSLLKGAVTDMYPTQNTYAGAVNYVIGKIYDLLVTAGNSDCQVVVVTPHCPGKYSYIDADGYTEYPSGSGQTLLDLCDIMVECANRNNIRGLNLWRLSGINRWNWALYAAEATPTNVDGHGEGPYPNNNDQLHLNTAVGYPYLGGVIARYVATF